ncbi:MAG: hypothetical protein AAFR22_07250 [Chloroflexota bacterium]
MESLSDNKLWHETMSDQIVTLLHSDNPQQRKRGISAAAKSADTRYLKPLAQIYKTDPDPDMREIAKKAGIYITRNQHVTPPPPPAAPSPAPTSAEDSFVALRDDLMADVARAADEPEPEPEPLTIPDLMDDMPSADDMLEMDDSDDVSPSADDILDFVPQVALEDGEANPELAEVHYNTAFELHLKQRDARAALELATAFKLNPNYVEDPTAIALASELTGINGNEVAAYITNTDNWREMVDNLGGIQKSPEDREWVQGFAMWALGAMGIVLLFSAFIVLVQSEQFIAAAEQVVEGTLDNLFGGAVSDLPSPE